MGHQTFKEQKAECFDKLSAAGRKRAARVLTVEQCRVMMAKMKEADKALFISLLLCGSKARMWDWQDALNQTLDLPMAVYQALRALATSRQLTLFPFNFAGFTQAHWVRGVKLASPIFAANIPHRFDKLSAAPALSHRERGQPLTTQEVTRRMKRYARLAGLNEREVNLQTVLNTHRWLVKCYGSADEASEAICPMVRIPADRPAREALTVSWVPLIPALSQPFDCAQGRRAREKASQDPRLHGIGRRRPTPALSK